MGHKGYTETCHVCGAVVRTNVPTGETNCFPLCRPCALKMSEEELYGVTLSEEEREIAKDFWPHTDVMPVTRVVTMEEIEDAERDGSA